MLSGNSAAMFPSSQMREIRTVQIKDWTKIAVKSCLDYIDDIARLSGKQPSVVWYGSNAAICGMGDAVSLDSYTIAQTTSKRQWAFKIIVYACNELFPNRGSPNRADGLGEKHALVFNDETVLC